MTLTEYRIDTGLFAGPLDLMLYLVRRTEVDVCSVSLARITSDFVDYIEVLEFLELAVCNPNRIQVSGNVVFAQPK